VVSYQDNLLHPTAPEYVFKDKGHCLDHNWDSSGSGTKTFVLTLCYFVLYGCMLIILLISRPVELELYVWLC